MFTTRAVAEIFTSHKNRCALEFGKIQFEISNLVSIFIESPVVEQELAESSPLDSFEKLFGDDLVGVNVGAIHCRHGAGMLGE